MTKTIIFTIVALTGLLVFGFTLNDSFSETNVAGSTAVKAIPDWVDQSFRWYGQGQIQQSELLNSMKYLLDNSIMHISDKAAKEMHDLKAENKKLRQMAHYDGVKVTAKSPGMMDSDKSMMRSDPAMMDSDKSRMRSDPAMMRDVWIDGKHHKAMSDKEILERIQTKDRTNSEVCFASDQNTDKSSCWIRASQASRGNPDRPIITGQVYSKTTDRPTEEVAFYYKKISAAHDTIDDIIAKGGSSSAWNNGIDQLTSSQSDSSVDSVVDDLQGVVVLCSTAIEKEIQKIKAQVDVLEELHDREVDEPSEPTRSSTQYRESDLEFISRHADKIDAKIKSLQTGLEVLEEKLATAGDDAQLANIDLQNVLQKQQQALQMISNVMKSMQDTQLATISRIG